MRRVLVMLLLAALAAGCTSEQPSATPTTRATAQGSSTAPAAPPSGASPEPTPYTVPTSPATVPLTEMTRQPDGAALHTHHRSLGWRLIRLYDGGKTLAIQYAPGCEEDRGTVQLEQTPEYVLVGVVHPEPTSNLACLRTYRRKVTLDAPLAGRPLLHAPTR